MVTLGKYLLTLMLLGLMLSFGALMSEEVHDPDTYGMKLVLDLVLALVGVGLLPLRHRFPVGVALVLSGILIWSNCALAPWSFAAVHLGRRRRPRISAAVVVLATLTGWANEYWMYGPQDRTPATVLWPTLLLVLVVNALITSIGMYLGARDALVDSLRDRAETAERAQSALAEQARTAERTRIAREMHDVLAHRISTVAMHSGALAYRTDLSPEQVRASAVLIQDHAHTALEELRDILGVLRDGAPRPSTPERPQPTIGDLHRLVEESAATDLSVELDLQVDPGTVPTSVGRTVYRCVQECLTNARKHAPGSAVDVVVQRLDDSLAVVVSNPLTTPDTAVPSAGVGLLGMSERAQLSGGRLVHGPIGDRYVTRITIPLTERTPE